MDKKIHITLKGNPDVCRATTKACPLGGEHYATREEAMEAYEAANAQASIPLAIQRSRKKEIADLDFQSGKRDFFKSVLENPKLSEGADPEVSKKLLAYLNDSAKSPWSANVEGISPYNESDSFVVDHALENFDLTPEQKSHFYRFAQGLAVDDLDRAAFHTRPGLHDSILGDIYEDEDALMRNLQRVTNDDALEENPHLKIYKSDLVHYNRALMRANRISKDYDAHLKSQGKAGFPKNWKEARALSKAPRLIQEETIDLEKYLARGQVVRDRVAKEATWGDSSRKIAARKMSFKNFVAFYASDVTQELSTLRERARLHMRSEASIFFRQVRALITGNENR